MPYKIAKIDNEFCVINKTTGENKGCSDSKVEAVKHMRALYAAEGMSKKEINSLVAEGLLALEETQEIAEEKKDIHVENIPAGSSGYYNAPTTYAELDKMKSDRETEDEINEIVSDFPVLVSNIMYSVEIEDKQNAIISLAGELAERLQGLGKEQDIKESENDAEKAQSENIFNRVISSVKEMLGVSKKESNMMVWKETNGTWHWLARYSNSFRDRDNPPEIITSKSHRGFVDKVDKGLAPMPELWLWHVKDWKFGQATLVAYDEVDEKSGFALAYGYILPGFEQVAEWLSKLKNVKVSHGMPVTTIKRDPTDKSIIIEHETREISPLPDWAAANEITGFVTFKEVDMAIPAEKRKKLIEWGLSDELLKRVEETNSADADKASSDGIESKEIPEESSVPDVASVVEPEISSEELITEVSSAIRKISPEEIIAEVSKEVSKSVPTREEIAEAMLEIVRSISEIKERIDAISKEFADKKAAEEIENKERERNTPTASLLAMISGSNRAVGNPRNEITDELFLAVSKPKETDPGAGRTGIPFIDNMLSK